MKIRLLGVLLAALACPVLAQSIPVASNNLSSTITTTNTFQSIQAVTNNRLGCTVQNNASSASGDLMWVYFDKSNSANCSAAVKSPGSATLLPGQSVNCSVAGTTVLKDQVCITGTSGDAYFANFQ